MSSRESPVVHTPARFAYCAGTYGYSIGAGGSLGVKSRSSRQHLIGNSANGIGCSFSKDIDHMAMEFQVTGEPWTLSMMLFLIKLHQSSTEGDQRIIWRNVDELPWSELINNGVQLKTGKPARLLPAKNGSWWQSLQETSPAATHPKAQERTDQRGQEVGSPDGHWTGVCRSGFWSYQEHLITQRHVLMHKSM